MLSGSRRFAGGARTCFAPLFALLGCQRGEPPSELAAELARERVRHHAAVAVPGHRGNEDHSVDEGGAHSASIARGARRGEGGAPRMKQARGGLVILRP